MAISGVTTFLWFDTQALEAAEFYVDVFPGASLGAVEHFPEGIADQPAGGVVTVSFTLFGQEFVALNGGPRFPHSEAVSFMVHCDTQEELDSVWDALVADGGAESQCGWCKDRFGVSWQVVPTALPEYLARGAWPALLNMTRINIAELEAASAQGST
jgi:predicted 3-demethylubiquinone-9 3-methyltransferase (glyoxalase superfamily)